MLVGDWSDHHASSLMEFRHLRSFVAAGRLEHFGRAAARLAIVQPALSRQIQELEEEIGTPLFERLPRGVRLTAAGRGFLREAEALLVQADRAIERTRDAGAGQAGRLRIGYVDTSIYLPALPGLLQGFRQKFPRVQLELVQQTSAAQAESLRAGAIDAGFVYHVPAHLPALGTRRLLSERIELALPASHRLAGRRRLRLRELRDEDYVWIPRAVSPPFYDAVAAACRRAGFEPRVVQEGLTDLAILSLVAAGAGLTFCVASAAHRKPQNVVLARVADLGLTVHLTAIWRTDNPNPALPHFLAQVPAAK